MSMSLCNFVQSWISISSILSANTTKVLVVLNSLVTGCSKIVCSVWLTCVTLISARCLIFSLPLIPTEKYFQITH